MKRTRGPLPKDPRLKPYPGLTLVNGVYHIRHPLTGRRASLATKEFQEAITQYAAARARWKDEVEEVLSDRIVEKLLDLASTPVAIKHRKSAGTTLADYAAHVRVEYLGVVYDENNKIVHPVEPKMMSKTNIDKRKGKPIGVRTARDYGAMSRFQIEPSTDLQFPLSTARETSVMYLRAFLKPWLGKATHYNHMRNYLSKVYQQAILEGICMTNPCDDIGMLATNSRKVYLTDDAYVAITTAMMTDQVFDVKRGEYKAVSAEWQSRTVDQLYLISGRPGDVLQLLDTQYRIEQRDNGEWHGELTFETAKTGTPQVIELNDAIIQNVLWFRAWKKAQGLVSRYLICYPTYYAMTGRWRNLVGQPVSVNFLSGRFRECVLLAHKRNPELGLYNEATGSYKFHLYDNRGRGLTDERRNQGKATGKGGHRSDASERVYVVDDVPVRSTATLVRIGEERKKGL